MIHYFLLKTTNYNGVYIFFSPKNRSRISGTWMGDPEKLLVFQAIINIIEQQNLLQNVRKTGECLKSGLMDIEIDYYDLIHSTRGLGIFLAFDAQCPPLRDDILKRLRQKGEEIFVSIS